MIPGLVVGGGWLSGSLIATGAVLLLVLLYQLLAAPRGSRSRRRSSEDAVRRVLQEQYARGELTSKQYRERLAGSRRDGR